MDVRRLKILFFLAITLVLLSVLWIRSNGTSRDPNPAETLSADVLTYRKPTHDVNAAYTPHKSSELMVSPEFRGICQNLNDFATSGKVATVTNLSKSDILTLAAYAATNLSHSQIQALLQDSSGIPPEVIPSNSDVLAEFLGNWFEAIRGDDLMLALPSVPTIVPIGFSITTDNSGRIVSTAANFPAGINTIYGVFENRWWPAGLSRVLAVWRNTDENKVVYQQVESIFPDSNSNYVWVNSGSGIPAGHWQLDLFDPTRNFGLLATGKFTTE